MKQKYEREFLTNEHKIEKIKIKKIGVESWISPDNKIVIGSAVAAAFWEREKIDRMNRDWLSDGEKKNTYWDQ